MTEPSGGQAISSNTSACRNARSSEGPAGSEASEGPAGSEAVKLAKDQQGAKQ